MLISERNSSDGVIEARFIRAALQRYGEDVMDSSKKARSKARTIDTNRTGKKRKYKTGFSSSEWDSASTIKVDKNKMTYTIPKPMRFVDMKKQKQKKKRNHPVHNKPTSGHKRYLIRTLSFGFTEEIKEKFRQLEYNVNN
ncbi:hypothetical protein [Bergeyella zoohelcum]|uniref:Phage virion morphogenesis family n=1 Tax=Bergeyella zoohelcum TaxID=1015 RepID=A0A7Z8YPR3_9FLAO|nr:hypothetical protein [Bergeyella zoohelcum]VDH05862.1 Uncharacterised protein [Bergeyella zoohelcum]